MTSTHTIDLGIAGFLVQIENLGAWPPILLLAVAQGKKLPQQGRAQGKKLAQPERGKQLEGPAAHRGKSAAPAGKMKMLEGPAA